MKEFVFEIPLLQLLLSGKEVSWLRDVTLVDVRSVSYLVSLVKGSEICLVVISSGSSVLSSRLTLATMVCNFLDFC